MESDKYISDIIDRIKLVDESYAELLSVATEAQVKLGNMSRILGALINGRVATLRKGALVSPVRYEFNPIGAPLPDIFEPIGVVSYDSGSRCEITFCEFFGGDETAQTFNADINDLMFNSEV